MDTADPDVARTGISKNILTVTALGYGLTTISVTAKDACRETCTFSFRILVRDKSRPVDLYPNPVVDILNIRPGTDGSYAISISNKAGATVWSATVDAGPFRPLTVDLSGCSGGTYYVRIDGGGVDDTFTVIKI